MKINGMRGSILLFLSLAVTYGQGGLYINEFMADNSTCIQDTSDGGYDDWLEIYNAGTAAVSLVNYYLTDNLSQPTQWFFPDTSIAAGGFLLVWTDDDEGDAGLHTNFKLSKSGESVGLFYSTGDDPTVVDSLTFSTQLPDISFGRYPDGGANWQSFTVPTPGASNDTTTVNTDSSAVIFDPTVVHDYYLHFYIADWADSLEYNYENGELYLPAQFSCNGIVLDSIGVRYKGHSSYQLASHTPKKPFKFKFTKYHNNQIFYNVKELNFSNCVKDPSFMRETISYDIARRYMPAPRTAYANIFVDSVLIGLYVQVENVEEIYLARNFADGSGNLYKAGDDGATLEYLGSDQAAYEALFELKTNEEANDWSGLIAMIAALNNTTDDEFYETVGACLNFDQAARLLALNMVLSNFDSYTGSGRNFYLYDDPATGQFQYLPWDFNESFGAYSYNWDPITVDIIDVPNLAARPLNRRLLADANLRNLYLSYIEDMINGPAATDSVQARTETIRDLIDSYVQADGNKLYTYNNFLANIEHNVTVTLGTVIPGVLSLSQARNANLGEQLAATGDDETGSNLIYSFRLQQNFPNPFNPNTRIVYELPQSGSVNLTVYDIAGRVVRRLVHTEQPAGQYSVVFDGSGLASGIYFYRLETTGGFTKSRKMVLLK